MSRRAWAALAGLALILGGTAALVSHVNGIDDPWDLAGFVATMVGVGLVLVADSGR